MARRGAVTSGNCRAPLAVSRSSSAASAGRPSLLSTSDSKHPAAALDDRRRPDVVVVARDEHTVDADGTGDAPGSGAGSRSRSPRRRCSATHGVADVPALPGEELVELMTDRRPADEHAVDVGDEERRRHEPVGHLDTSPLGVDRAAGTRPKSSPGGVAQPERERLVSPAPRGLRGTPPRLPAVAGAAGGSRVTGHHDLGVSERETETGQVAWPVAGRPEPWPRRCRSRREPRPPCGGAATWSAHRAAPRRRGRRAAEPADAVIADERAAAERCAVEVGDEVRRPADGMHPHGRTRR